jgi:hypothetical protein
MRNTARNLARCVLVVAVVGALAATPAVSLADARACRRIGGRSSVPRPCGRCSP